MRDEILNTVDRYIERYTYVSLPENILVNYYLLKLRNYLVWVYMIFLQSENLLNTLYKSIVIFLDRGDGEGEDFKY